MIIKIRCSDTVGGGIMRFLAAIEMVAAARQEGATALLATVGRAVQSLSEMLASITEDYTPEDLQFEAAQDTSERTGGGGPRTRYWAKLPKLPDGAFDMASVDDTVRRNLAELKAHTVNGIIYQDIVSKTLAGEIATEPALRKERMMKSGSSQRAVQVLYNMGLIDRGPIKVEEAGQ